MKSLTFGLSALFAALLSAPADAHTTIWSVWVNGVDQGTGNGIRKPAFNGAMSEGGYNNSPVRDLSAIDLRCNVMGEVPNNITIKTQPGDVVTFEWHHNFRNASDDILATSHKGPGLVYISTDPPTDSSWVKLQEQGESPPGTWYAGDVLNERLGKQDVQIPDGLAPGFYLLRAELIALHEANVAYIDDTGRGAQIYADCVQIEVQGNGTVPLPAGVGFPGAYQYTDPGIVYNLYSSSAGQEYTIPGPAVWTAAAASPTPPPYGETVGYSTYPDWNTWIGEGIFSDATTVTSVTVAVASETAAFAYHPVWPTTYVEPAIAIQSIDASYAVHRPVPAAMTPPPRV